MITKKELESVKKDCATRLHGATAGKDYVSCMVNTIECMAATLKRIERGKGEPRFETDCFCAEIATEGLAEYEGKE